MLYEIINKYKPVNEQEEKDQKAMLQFLDNNKNALLRENLAGHFTSSAIVVNENYDKVLFIHHNIYNAWGWTGGHNDGDNDPKAVAVKEAKEETGLVHIRVHEDILGIDAVYVQNHIRRGEYVNDHIHFNVTYLVVANEEDSVEAKLDENSDVRWFEIDTVLESVDEERMIPIYSKLFSNIKRVKESRLSDY